jgi:hypothetical protein
MQNKPTRFHIRNAKLGKTRQACETFSKQLQAALRHPSLTVAGRGTLVQSHGTLADLEIT